MPLSSALSSIVGSRHVLERRGSLLAYESDALPGYRRRPSLAVFPGTRDETLAVIRLLAAEGLPFVPRGAGTGLSGGALADGVVLLGLQRLKRILDLDPANRRATVEPGVVNATLTAAAAPYGLHYAPDPSSQTACTIGGNVAENSGGPHCLKYGVTLNHVEAATVALPDGTVVPLRLPRGPADGFDLLGAFVGSEGCFGVALDVTVSLTPDPQAVRTLLADFMTIETAAQATSGIVAAGIVPAACELMDRGTIAAVEASIYAAGYPVDAAAVLLVEVDGATDAVADEATRVEEICRANGARSVRVPADPADRARLWQGRKKAFGAMGRVAPHLFVQDAVVPRTRLAEILTAIGAIGDRYGVQVCNVFHAGDGNLHPNIPYDGRNPDERDRVHRAMQEIMTLCISFGGSITGEHGVGLDKIGYMDRLFSPDTLDAMCRLRSAFDPDRRANPGKVVPVHSCREWGPGRDPGPAATDWVAPEREPATAHTPGGALERELAAAIHDADQRQQRVFISGAGTHIATPPADALVVSVRSHAEIIEYVPQDLTITVGAGITLEELFAVTSARGQWCPILPWGGDGCTLGGALASAARGPAAAAFGTPRDLVLGVTFVDGTGAVVTAGGRVVKNVAGFDLTRALIGSWGALGVITAASLRLKALPAAQETWAVSSAGMPGEQLKSFLRGPLAPASYDVIPGTLAQALGLPGTPHAVFLLAGSVTHVRASREALRAFPTAQVLPASSWDTVRSYGPFTERVAEAAPPQTQALNLRLRRAFDPRCVFTSPAFPDFAAEAA